MLNAILAIGTSERRTDSLVRIRIYNEQVFPMGTLAFDRPFDIKGVHIFIIVSDRKCTSCLSPQSN